MFTPSKSEGMIGGSDVKNFVLTKACRTDISFSYSGESTDF